MRSRPARRLLLLALAGALGLSACTPSERPGGPRIDMPAVGWRSQADTGDARALLAAIDRAGSHGLDPDRLLPPDERAQVAAALSASAPGSAERLKADALLSLAYLRWSEALATPDTTELALALPEVLPRPLAPEARLRRLAEATDLQDLLLQEEQRHPFYDRLRDALADALEKGAPEARILRLTRNLERARLLPREGRHIVVDTAGARLHLFDGDRLEGSMRVVVGSRAHQTPQMASVVELAIARPYWNVPEDLARDRIARRVLREGPSHLSRQHMQLLSDWTPEARPLPATAIDWQDAAAGRISVRLRQEPGPWNMMGQMKFMIRNDLGIYLHDTPERRLFRAADRTESAGCVRVEDWKRLRDWLFEGAAPKAESAPEQLLPLPRPVAIYLLHFTVDPADQRAPNVPDRYGRDAPPEVRLAAAS